VVNAIKFARKYTNFLDRPEVIGYRDAAKKFGVSKAIVSLHVAIITRLPEPFIEWLENCKDKLVLAFFSERRLRPVTRTEGEDQKITGLLGLIDECERQLEEENRSLNQARELLSSLVTVDSDPVAPTPNSREHRSIQLD